MNCCMNVPNKDEAGTIRMYLSIWISKCIHFKLQLFVLKRIVCYILTAFLNVLTILLSHLSLFTNHVSIQRNSGIDAEV